MRKRSFLLFSGLLVMLMTLTPEIKALSIITDFVPPASTVDFPPCGSYQIDVDMVHGTASDDDSGVSEVMLQIMNEEGGYYTLDLSGPIVSTPTWLTATGTDTWTLDTSSIDWVQGADYTIKVQTTDSTGNLSSINCPFTIVDTVYDTSVTINLSAQSILPDDVLDVSGALVSLPDDGQNMKGHDITIAAQSPSGTTTTYTITTDGLGQYVTNISGFNEYGDWMLQVHFNGITGLYNSSESDAVTISVKGVNFESYVFERMWPVLPQPWYFNNPYDVTVDAEGSVYVADTNNHRIQKFGRGGNFITRWGSVGSGDGEFDLPRGITLDTEGNVYVADTNNHRIQKFDNDGNFIASWGSIGNGDGEFDLPMGITVDAEGNVYVADTHNDRIQKFDSDGNFITRLGSEGSGNGQFHWPRGVTVDVEGNVYVADTYNDRIQKFDSDGNFIAGWGSEGSGGGEFNNPDGITVDAEGNMYVADTYNDRIQKFDSNGNLIASLGSEGSGNVEFHWPRGITVDVEGNVYVADSLNHRIQKFDNVGTFISKGGSGGSEDGKFDYPGDITIDAEGDVYVADTNNDRIQKFDSDGNFISRWGSYGSGDGEFDGPFGIAVDAAGNVYVADTYNGRIQKFDSDGNFITRWKNGGNGVSEFYLPYGITVDKEGNVYVSDNYNNGRIQKFDSDGNFISRWGSEGSGDWEFIRPFGITVDAKDNVYVVDRYNDRIQKFDSDGSFITRWGSYGSEDGEFNNPGGITVDAEGNIYVADTNNNRIQKFDSDGNFITKYGTSGSSPGQINEPYGLTIGSNGSIYIADSANNRIQILRGVDMLSNSKAIVVAGGGPFKGNNLWDTTQMLANYAYRTLTFQGYTKDTINYISADTDLDLDGNGILDDVDADATIANLEEAITVWAVDASDVVIYLVDHGGDGTFRMSETEIMTATEVDSWLDVLQESITGRLTVVYEACESGSFMDVLTPSSGQERTLITSTSPGENAYFVSEGTVSFSSFFWGHIFSGTNVYNAFILSSNAISFSVAGQTPLLDDNGNGIGNEKEDGLVSIKYFIGNGTEIGGDIPLIGTVSTEQVLGGETTALIWAEDIVTTGTIERVWAVIKRPDSIPGASDIPITDIPSLDLKDAGDGRYEGTYNDFLLIGTYDINIYAKDINGNISLPKTTNIYQQAGNTIPSPDITANGSDASISIQYLDPLFVRVSLDPGDYNGSDSDWWVHATSPFGTYWYTFDSGWLPSNTPMRIYGGPLYSLEPYTILNMSTLPIGDYTFSFEVDNNMDNVRDGTYGDSVQVTIE